MDHRIDEYTLPAVQPVRRRQQDPLPKWMDIYPDFVHEHINGATERIFAFLMGL